MPAFLIERKRIQISTSTLAFSNRFRPSTLAVRKRYVFVLRGRLNYRVHDVSVFENLRFRRFHPSTLIRKASVFESLHLGRRFRKPPFSWVKVSVFHRISVDDWRKRIQKYPFSNENGLVWTGPKCRNFKEPNKYPLITRWRRCAVSECPLVKRFASFCRFKKVLANTWRRRGLLSQDFSSYPTMNYWKFFLKPRTQRLYNLT